MNKLFFFITFANISFSSDKTKIPSIQVNTGYEIDQKGKITIGKQIIKYPGENIAQTIINKLGNLSKYKNSFYKIISIFSIILFFYKKGKSLNKKAKKIINKEIYTDIKFLSIEEFNYAINEKNYIDIKVLSNCRLLKSKIEDILEYKLIYFFYFIPFLFKDLKQIIKESLDMKQKIDLLIEYKKGKIK
jgi:hypothetical protein